MKEALCLIAVINLLLIIMTSCGADTAAQHRSAAAAPDGGLLVTEVVRPGVRCLYISYPNNSDSARMSCSWGEEK